MRLLDGSTTHSNSQLKQRIDRPTAVAQLSCLGISYRDYASSSLYSACPTANITYCNDTHLPNQDSVEPIYRVT